MKKYARIVFAGLAASLFVSILTQAQTSAEPVGVIRTFTPEPTRTAPAQIAVYRPTVLAVYPHSTGDFTQGLVWNDGELFQSAGRYGESRLQQLVLEDGSVVQSVPVPDEFFAEGLALVGDRLIQLTWREETAFIYDAETFEPVGTYTYEGEGWGLCYDGEVLWMSDGSPNLFVRDAETFELLNTIPVTYFDSPVANINELECVGESVYANVWQTDFIIEIDKDSGSVISLIDASELLTPEERAELNSGGVLNGIAYIPETETFLLTGKLWPSMFEVTFSLAGYLQPRSVSG